MSSKNTEKEEVIAKFKSFINTAGVGIFTTKKRRRLAGELGLAGRDRTKNDFWYDVREKVKRALVDFEIFIKFSDKDQVDQVLTEETLRPVVEALLQYESDLNRAEIARLFIEGGFRYLNQTQRKNITLSHERTIREAVDLANYLVETYNPEKSTRFLNAPRP